MWGDTCPICGWVDPEPPKRIDWTSEDEVLFNNPITHYVPAWLLWLWKHFACRDGWHAWDEVYTLERHYLVCDACGKEIDLR